MLRTACFLLIASHVAAQSVPTPGVSFYTTDASAPFFYQTPASTAGDYGFSGSSGTVTMPFDHATAIAQWSTGKFVVAGLHSATLQSQIVEVDLSTSPPTVGTAANLTFFISDLVYEVGGSNLFAFDFGAKVISHASFSGGALPTSWAVAANSTAIPVLGNPDSPLFLDLTTEIATGNVVLKSDPFLSIGHCERWTFVPLGGGGWNPVADVPPSAPTVPPQVVPTIQFSPTGSVVQVYGVTGAFTLRNGSGAILTTLTSASAQTVHTVSLPAGVITDGDSVYVEQGGSAVSESLDVQPVWDRATSTTDIDVVDSFVPDVPLSGDSYASISVKWPTSLASQNVLISLHIGAWTPFTNPTAGTPPFISPILVSLPTQQVELLETGVGTFVYKLALGAGIPLGTQLCFQFAGADPSLNVFSSDVHGVVVGS